MEFYAWADNLLGKDYERASYQRSPIVTMGAPAKGHTIGIRFSYCFRDLIRDE